MLSLVLSTITYFVAYYLIKRYLDNMDIPRGITRGLLIFSLALGIAYGVAGVVNWVVG